MIPLFRKKPTPFYRPPPQPKPTQTMSADIALHFIAANPPRPTQTMEDTLQFGAMTVPNPLKAEILSREPVRACPELQFQLLNPLAKLPTRGSEHAAGLDLYAASWQPYGESMIQYDTGVAVAIPEGYVGLVFPRSSITGTSLRLGNAVAVIDSDYRGPIMLKFDLLTHYADSDRPYAEGDRIGQLVVVPAPRFDPVQVDELPATTRGSGGFGSSGR